MAKIDAQVLQIEVGKKNLLILTQSDDGPFDLSSFEYLKKSLTLWMESDDPIFILVLPNDMKVRQKKVDNG